MRVCRASVGLLLGLIVLLGMFSAHPAATSAQINPWTCDAAAPASHIAASPVAVEAIPFPENAGTLTVYAAASLTDAFDDVATTLESANPGLDIIDNYAGSQLLVTQLTQGAPADIVALASNSAMGDAIENGVVTAEPRPFVENRLTIVVPTDNPAGISSAADLAEPGVKLVLAQEAVPVGGYARASLCAMATDAATYGDDFIANVAVNVVSEEDNVRSVLSKVTLGEADAGIVYTSDVKSADNVLTIEIPEAVNELATYPIAPVAAGNQELAEAYISFILSPEGQAILESYGFIPVD